MILAQNWPKTAKSLWYRSFNKVSGSIVVLSEISFDCARGEPWMTIEQRIVYDYLGFKEKSFKNKAAFLFIQWDFYLHNYPGKWQMMRVFIIVMELRKLISVMFWSKLILVSYIPPLTSISSLLL